MPVIPEETGTMDDFVNWDNAGPAVGVGAPLDLDLVPSFEIGHEQDEMGLLLEDVNGDDFSFWALEHYAQTNLESTDVPPSANRDGTLPGWALPEAPCANCQNGGYHCKRIREGSYGYYCTSCVALGCECSFGLTSAVDPSSQSATFPPNPWPTLGDHPNSILQAPDTRHMTPSSGSPGLAVTATEAGEHKAGPKIGARFSRESVKILKNWLSTHSRHPYPTDDERESLQKLTGLNKTQITNWLANARRRGKIQPPRSTSPHVPSWSGAIDIPQRRGTPSPLGTPQRRGTPSPDAMNPLQRWCNSPPENEPASVTDIARAIGSSSSALSSGLESPHSFNYTDDGSGRSLCHGSSASSAGTSHSGNSFASAFSHASRGSFGSLGSHGRGRRRRRRRTAAPKVDDGPTSLLEVSLKTFQCTFCTETFRTKHDWQRHEKSLHLSLERWICAPQGPTVVHPDTKQLCCVFCGEGNPDEAHIEGHNYPACQERALGDRTFYRKDHLRQHLKLVHNVKFAAWSMEPWKVASPEIRSRCGFCGIVMDSWSIRVDHLAEHFKTGDTMANWKGDWGFEAGVLKMVENSIPPYLIHNERYSPLPFAASRTSPASPKNAYELIKSELAFYAMNEKDAGKTPTDEELQLEACRIAFGSEVLSKKTPSSAPSWLRDLVMSKTDIARQAQLSPIRSYSDSRMAALKINGKDNVFEDCPLERQLREFVKAREHLGLTAMDSELQIEACNIMARMEESSSTPSEEVANFLLRLIYGSTSWLADFRQRAHLPRSEDLGDEKQRSKDPMTIDSTIHNYSRLETELAEYVRSQRATGVEPSDCSLRRQARIIIYEFDDGWNQTAADSVEWLMAFRNRHLHPDDPASQIHCNPSPPTVASLSQESPAAEATAMTAMTSAMLDAVATNALRGVSTGSGNPLPAATASTSASLQTKTVPFFLNDANCYRRLARELTRFVKTTMSPNNPNFHVPTDEELQHQSRWILYDDDDPWNQTAADNAEWLRRFKRDVGILPADDGPGLPTHEDGWNVNSGGSGFAPPYAFPKASMGLFPDMAPVGPRDGAAKGSFAAEPATAGGFLQTLTTTRHHQAPAAVFCSRELEKGLIAFTRDELARGGFPTDGSLQQKAREILGTEAATAADDDVLLAKFKEMVQARHAGQAATAPAPAAAAVAVAEPQAQAIPELTMTDAELNDILQDMDFDFVDDLDLGGGAPLNS